MLAAEPPGVVFMCDLLGAGWAEGPPQPHEPIPAAPATRQISRQKETLQKDQKREDPRQLELCHLGSWTMKFATEERIYQ